MKKFKDVFNNSYTENFKAFVSVLYKLENVSVSELVNTYGISDSSVYNWGKKYAPKKIDLSDEDIKIKEKMEDVIGGIFSVGYKDDKQILLVGKETDEKYDIKVSLIKEHLKEAGITAISVDKLNFEIYKGFAICVSRKSKFLKDNSNENSDNEKKLEDNIENINSDNFKVDYDYGGNENLKNERNVAPEEENSDDKSDKLNDDEASLIDLIEKDEMNSGSEKECNVAPEQKADYKDIDENCDFLLDTEKTEEAEELPVTKKNEKKAKTYLNISPIISIIALTFGILAFVCFFANINAKSRKNHISYSEINKEFNEEPYIPLGWNPPAPEKEADLLRWKHYDFVFETTEGVKQFYNATYEDNWKNIIVKCFDENNELKTFEIFPKKIVKNISGKISE